MPALTHSLRNRHALGFANQHGAATLGNCELLLGGPIATLLTMSTVAGTAHFALPLPAVPQLLGVRFVAQGFALDGFVPGGFSASDGLLFVVGR